MATIGLDKLYYAVITEDANGDIRVYGIEIIQSEIKALDLPEDNKAAVFTRMISERENIAAGYTADHQDSLAQNTSSFDPFLSVSRTIRERFAINLFANTNYVSNTLAIHTYVSVAGCQLSVCYKYRYQ